MPIHETVPRQFKLSKPKPLHQKEFGGMDDSKTSENLNLEQTFKIIPSDFIKKEWKGLLLLTLNMLFATGKWFSG